MRFRVKGSLVLGKDLRRELASPFGIIADSNRLEKTVKKTERIYAVGDVTVATLLRLGYTPKVSIFDYRTGRSRRVYPIIKRTYKSPLRVKNARGTISLRLWNAINAASKSNRDIGIYVIGEEDLASLVCINFARMGDIVVYGLRKKGIAVIRVDKRIKKYVLSVLRKMSMFR
ncbi:MAG: DUF359 domain-containing protein [Candidatus Marsarchaeota archaeon]|nr:DUF359 domain-containing protein [Candidatus Marsarchaeota archaeon]MCL5412865.1 DUF359 domain-containing protein [Candidatus Marsarchaeota archaeon]